MHVIASELKKLQAIMQKQSQQTWTFNTTLVAFVAGSLPPTCLCSPVPTPKQAAPHILSVMPASCDLLMRGVTHIAQLMFHGDIMCRTRCHEQLTACALNNKMQAVVQFHITRRTHIGIYVGGKSIRLAIGDSQLVCKCRRCAAYATRRARAGS